jgi:hypothetical protein
VEEEWEKTDEFHERWKIKARDLIAKTEFRRRKLTKRVRKGSMCQARGFLLGDVGLVIGPCKF